MRPALPVALLALAPPHGRAEDAGSALAWLQAFNADLLSHDSATAVLQRLCDAAGIGPGLQITARQEPGPAKPADAEVRRDLQAGPDTPLKYRRVALACGDLVLSRADNWYRPDRLTPQMNRLLEETQTPFGVAVGPLNFHRRTLSAQLLASPPQVLAHRAVLETPDGAAFSLVVETYSDAVLTLGPPAT